MREYYEREKNRNAQRKIIERFCLNDIKFKETDRLNPYDYELYCHKDRLFAIAEVKRRNVGVNIYGEIILSKRKVDKCIEAAKERECDFIFIVGFDDALAFSRIYQHGTGDIAHYIKIGIGGRSDRKDSKDIEPVYLIPNSMFYKIPFREECVDRAVAAWIKEGK